VINGGNDLDETTLFKIRKPDPCSVTAPNVALSLDARDADRVRVYQVAGGAPGTWSVRLGPGLSQFTLPNASLPWAFDFRVEALTLPGDSALPAPGGASPNKPDPFPATLPTGSTGTPVSPSRAPGDVWLEVVNPAPGMAGTAPRDVALFTIAPFILFTNLPPTEKAYVAEIPDRSIQRLSPPAAPQDVPGNVPFVQDLADITSAIGVTLVKVPFAECSEPSGVDDFFGAPILAPDVWVQDEFEVGYCWAPNEWMHVVFHCKRDRGLKRFVRKSMADVRVGLYTGVSGPTLESLHYGGNLEVSPPITAATTAIPAGLDGPAVSAHPAAPFGKILIGDSSARSVDSDFRNFLQAQKVQPVLPVDTSWLAVGHVDEFMIFVKATRTSGDGTGPKGWVMLLAWPDLAIRLLEGAKTVGGVTNLFRSRRPRPPSFSMIPASRIGIPISTVLGMYTVTANPIRRLDRTAHNDQAMLDVILDRYKHGLGLTEKDFIRLPVLFSPGLPRTAAFTPGIVNLFPLGTDLVIPKPWGPRVPIAAARSIMHGIYGITDDMITAANLNSLRNEFYWARRGERKADIAVMFGVAEADVQPVGAGGVDMTGLVTDPWKKMQIMENNVDIFEAYVAVKLRNLGLTLHFVDDWDKYHVAEGEIHCGTNALRTPPERSGSSRKWWDTYSHLADVPPYAP